MPSPARKSIVYDVECMEKYPASMNAPGKVPRHRARGDVVVLLPAHRYGYRPTESNPDGRSITHLEYDEAGRHLGKPRLVFIVDPDHCPRRHFEVVVVFPEQGGP